MPISPFPSDPILAAVAQTYRNEAYIADAALPRLTVGKQEFKYPVFSKKDKFVIPATAVGRRSKPNEVEFTQQELTDFCMGYALDDPIPQDDIDNAPDNQNLVNAGTEWLADLIMLAREKRVADLLFTSGNYGGNTAALSGSDQWTHASSDPIAKIGETMDAVLMRPNIMVLGQQSWTTLRTHPLVMKAVNRTAGDAGMASRRAVADMLELDDIFVGMAYRDTAKKGQTASISRLWGDSCALLHISKTFSLTHPVPSFGFTAQWGEKDAGSWQDMMIGPKGGTRIRVLEYVREKIINTDCGYLLTDTDA